MTDLDLHCASLLEVEVTLSEQISSGLTYMNTHWLYVCIDRVCLRHKEFIQLSSLARWLRYVFIIISFTERASKQTETSYCNKILTFPVASILAATLTVSPKTS